jgi:uncharacterized protein YecE (DUF72 family)
MHRIGTAGWSVPKSEKEQGTHLSRYSGTLPCVDINSSFYRPHRATTWAKWAEETYRLHGSPRTYYSNYEDEFLTAFAAEIKSRDNVWVIFDNTALSYAYSNALKLQALMASSDI